MSKSRFKRLSSMRNSETGGILEQQRILEKRRKKAHTCPLCNQVGPKDIGFLLVGLSHPEIQGAIPLPLFICTRCGGAFMPKGDIENRMEVVGKQKAGGVILGPNGKVVV